ncbi:MAG: hypothetical protein ABJA79_08855 [Parafilimonas sp.]
MFNTPILDVAIGLIFIFLLYSLLATSINESIATALSLRARMLKKAISERMLSNSSTDHKMLDFLKGVLEYVFEIFYFITGRPKKKGSEKNIGDQFYDHPMIKNYGANRFFKTPSYLAASNFSIILAEALKEDFNNKVGEIALFKNIAAAPLQQTMDELSSASDLIKIKELFAYYAWYYAINPEKKIFDDLPHLPRGLDKETHCILQLHLRNSLYDFNAFNKKIEGWYNDTMDRVTGWYKRQIQFILFLLGMGIAISFNVDTIDIANKLSTDKTARDQIVQMAIKASEDYKDDPRVKKVMEKGDTSVEYRDTSVEYKEVMAKQEEIKETKDSTLKVPNEILGIGWGDYGKTDRAFIRTLIDKKMKKPFSFTCISLRDSFNVISERVNAEESLKRIKKDSLKSRGKKDTAHTKIPASIPAPSYEKRNPSGDSSASSTKTDSVNIDLLKYVLFYNQTIKKYPVTVKTCYVLHSIGAKKFIGFLLTAFAICLGAPFWFDLLNKLVRLRGAGKKEDASNTIELTATKDQVPATGNLNIQNASEEAVG